MHKLLFLSLFMMMFSFDTYSQNNIIDSLTSLSYETLKNTIKENKKDTLIQSTYLKALIQKSKKNKDTLNLCKAYNNCLKNTKNTETKIQYIDSIIEISENEKFHDFNLKANFLKGLNLYRKGNYNYALAYFIKTKKINKLKNYNKNFDILIEYNIGLLKNVTGKYSESIHLFKKYYKYQVSKGEKEITLEILPTIVDAYLHLKQIDSARKYNKILKTQLKNSSKNYLYTYYLINQGVILNYKKEYAKSTDSLSKALLLLKKNDDNYNSQFCHYYIGLNYHLLNNNKESIIHFKQMDSLILITKNLVPDIRKGYEYLIKHYKNTNEISNELNYLNRLLSVDSILNKNHRVLAEDILKEFDTPILINEKQRIINKLNKKKSTSFLYLYIALGVILVLIGITLHYFNENKKNIKRFEEIIKSKTETKVDSTVDLPEIKKLNINPDVIDQILFSLEYFEKNNLFIVRNITLQSLSKEFKTNPKYLSQIINHYKQKNFSNYINDLRITYTVKKLQNDVSFRNYTILAIGQEVGFNSAESFSKAFLKHTELKPSYFLKQLNK